MNPNRLFLCGVSQSPCVCLQETDAAQKALNEAKRAAEVKHGKWLEAEKAGKEADAYAAQKQAKVEEVLNDKITGLAQKAKASPAPEASNLRELGTARITPCLTSAGSCVSSFTAWWR